MQTNNNEEDWSIISSSSDVDEDQNINSSSEENREKSDDKVVSSVATLKLPCVATSKQVNSEVVADGKIDSVSDNTKVPDPNSVDHPKGYVSNAIKFYESLTARTHGLNESLKKRSHNFYRSFASLSLDKIGKCMSSTEDSKASGIHSADKGCSCSLIFFGKRLKNIRPTVCKFLDSNKMINYLNSYSEFLDENAGVLMYFIITVLIGAFTFCAVYYGSAISTWKSPPKPSRVTSMISNFNSIMMKTYERSYVYLDSLIYEEAKPSLSFFGLIRKNTPKKLRLLNKFEGIHKWSSAIYERSGIKVNNLSNKVYLDCRHYFSQANVIVQNKIAFMGRGLDRAAILVYESISPSLHMLTCYYKNTFH